jgi:hypothetical protein
VAFLWRFCGVLWRFVIFVAFLWRFCGVFVVYY